MNENLKHYQASVNQAAEAAQNMPDDRPLEEVLDDVCSGYPVYHKHILDTIRYSKVSPEEIEPIDSDGDNWEILKAMADRLFRTDVRRKLS